MATAGDHRLLTAAEERELARRIREDGDQAARERLILHNVRLVIGIARTHFRNSGVELDDLVQVGIIGLHRATEKFDERRGFKFSTYATQWVYQAMQRLTARRHTIQLPSEIAKIRLTHAVEPELGVRELAARHKATLSKVRMAVRAGHVSDSLDAPAGHGLQVHDDAPSADELIENGWLGSVPGLAEAVADLPDDQRAVLELAFRSDMDDREIARELGMTASKAAATRRAALERLRAVLMN